MKKTKKIIYMSYFLIYVLTTITILISLINKPLDDNNYVEIILNYIFFILISGIFITFDYKIKFQNRWCLFIYLGYLIIIPIILVTESVIITIISIVFFLLFAIFKTHQMLNKKILESNVRSLLEFNKLYFITLLLGVFINLSGSTLFITSILLFCLIILSETLIFVNLRKLSSNFEYIFLIELIIIGLIFILSYQGLIVINYNKSAFDFLTNLIYPLGSLLLTLILTYHNKIRINQLFKEISTE